LFISAVLAYLLCGIPTNAGSLLGHSIHTFNLAPLILSNLV